MDKHENRLTSGFVFFLLIVISPVVVPLFGVFYFIGWIAEKLGISLE